MAYLHPKSIIKVTGIYVQIDIESLRGRFNLHTLASCAFLYSCALKPRRLSRQYINFISGCLTNGDLCKYLDTNTEKANTF